MRDKEAILQSMSEMRFFTPKLTFGCFRFTENYELRSAFRVTAEHTDHKNYVFQNIYLFQTSSFISIMYAITKLQVVFANLIF
jgi:hypothetical protein